MNASHDGDESRDLPGGPCPWSHGFLMSYDRRDSRGVHWSGCSKWAMREFFKSEQAQCLRNKPNVGKSYPKILPGRVLSRDQQCRGNLGPGHFSSENHESNCAALHCKVYKGNNYAYVISYNYPPAEGTACGGKAICLDGQCVKDPGV